MIAIKEKNKLERLIEGHIEGIVLRNDYINWLIKLQQNDLLSTTVTVGEAIKVLEGRGVKVVKTTGKNLISSCKLPEMIEKKKPNNSPGKIAKYISKEDIEKLYIEENLNQYKVALMLHISTDRLQKLIREYGIVKVYEAGKPRLNKKELVELYNKGYSLNKIADLVGMSQTVIYKYAKLYRLKLRDQKHQRMVEVC